MHYYRGMRTYRGVPPHRGWQPLCLATFTLPDRSVWDLYGLMSRAGSEWLNLKLCAQGSAVSKANYWLGYSVSRQRLAESTDMTRLEVGRPALGRALLRFLRSLPPAPRATDIGEPNHVHVTVA